MKSWQAETERVRQAHRPTHAAKHKRSRRAKQRAETLKLQREWEAIVREDQVSD